MKMPQIRPERSKHECDNEVWFIRLTAFLSGSHYYDRSGHGKTQVKGLLCLLVNKHLKNTVNITSEVSIYELLIQNYSWYYQDTVSPLIKRREQRTLITKNPDNLSGPTFLVLHM